MVFEKDFSTYKNLFVNLNKYGSANRFEPVPGHTTKNLTVRKVMGMFHHHINKNIAKQ